MSNTAALNTSVEVSADHEPRLAAVAFEATRDSKSFGQTSRARCWRALASYPRESPPRARAGDPWPWSSGKRSCTQLSANQPDHPGCERCDRQGVLHPTRPGAVGGAAFGGQAGHLDVGGEAAAVP